MPSTISSKGQITVPKAVRDALGLKSGDAVEFVVRDGQALLRPAKAWTIDDAAGCLREFAHQGSDIRHGHKEALAAAMRAEDHAKRKKGRR
jgi:AbrB family looped-hinge helix DNA binding protein